MTIFIIYLIGVALAYLCIAWNNSKNDGMCPGFICILSFVVVLATLIFLILHSRIYPTWPFKRKK
jgi:hypothetical protein